MPDFKCRECEVALDRENTGGYRAGRPEICKGCEERSWLRAYAASLMPLAHGFPYSVESAPWE